MSRLSARRPAAPLLARMLLAAEPAERGPDDADRAMTSATTAAVTMLMLVRFAMAIVVLLLAAAIILLG